MHYPLRYDSLVQELFKRVPAFAIEREVDESYISCDDDSPYLVFGDFSRFLVDLIMVTHHEPAQERLLSDCFKLLDDMATSTDDEVVNVVETTVFEKLCDSPETASAARQYLSDKAVPAFDRVASFFS